MQSGVFNRRKITFCATGGIYASGSWFFPVILQLNNSSWLATGFPYVSPEIRDLCLFLLSIFCGRQPFLAVFLFVSAFLQTGFIVLNVGISACWCQKVIPNFIYVSKRNKMRSIVNNLLSDMLVLFQIGAYACKNAFFWSIG